MLRLSPKMLQNGWPTWDSLGSGFISALVKGDASVTLTHSDSWNSRLHRRTQLGPVSSEQDEAPGPSNWSLLPSSPPSRKMVRWQVFGSMVGEAGRLIDSRTFRRSKVYLRQAEGVSGQDVE